VRGVPRSPAGKPCLLGRRKFTCFVCENIRNLEEKLQYVRPVDFDSSEIVGEDGYQGKFLYRGERCVLIAARVPPGARGPQNHVHPMDQLYFVIEGQMSIKLGADVRRVTRGSAVFIPAGVPHHNWNEGRDDELHLEILAPGNVGILPILQFTESNDAGGLPFGVIHPAVSRMLSLAGGMTVTPLVGRDQGSNNAMIYIVGLFVGASGPNLYTHEFDQFCLVLEGQLGVQIGLEEYAVSPGQIVVLPAGVPHRQWNSGEGVERHLTIITPPPERPRSEEHPWYISVELRAVAQSAHVVP
jgi:quercetin dioxygenase-like cupin family protein